MRDMSIGSTCPRNVSIFPENIDITGKRVDDNDTFNKYVDFFTFFRHICHKIATN